MAARSEHSGYIRGLAARVTSKGPVSAAASRDALVNNANHLADECAQTRGAMMLPSGGGGVLLLLAALAFGKKRKGKR